MSGSTATPYAGRAASRAFFTKTTAQLLLQSRPLDEQIHDVKTDEQKYSPTDLKGRERPWE
jgi:hypothetical protein